jgi:hypothetical protein
VFLENSADLIINGNIVDSTSIEGQNGKENDKKRQDPFHDDNCGDELFWGLVQSSSLPPPEANKANDGQWCDHQVNDTAVQTLCGFVSKLLGCFGTN